MPNDVLARCPKCGGKAELRIGYARRDVGDVWLAGIYCTECDAFLERMVTRSELELIRGQTALKYNVMEKTIKAWNRRTGGEDDDA